MIGYNGFDNGIAYNAPKQGVFPTIGSSYAQNQILTASPEQVLIMLFDAAIRFNREAQAANNVGDTAGKLAKIGRVFNIICELSNTLEHNIGGEIAAELDALYQFHMQELDRARTDNSNKHLKFVEEFLVEWRETWLEVIDINRTGVAATAKQADNQYGRKLAVAG